VVDRLKKGQYIPDHYNTSFWIVLKKFYKKPDPQDWNACTLFIK